NDAIQGGDREGLFGEDHPWTVRREGWAVEDARFTISYSPIPEETAANGIGGVLITCVETTERVRKEATLRVLNEQLGAEITERIGNVIASGKCPKTCSAYRTSTAISRASTRHGLIFWAGARTRSRGCMSASCGIPTM